MGFGSSKQNATNTSTGTSSSSNLAYPSLNAAFGGQTEYTGRSNNAIADLLGLNGAGAQTGGFDRFRDSSGYQFIQDEGVRGISANAASRGLLNSGSFGKGIAKYSSNLANSYLDKYMQSLTGLGNSGLQAGQVIAGAGGVSNSSQQSQGQSSGRSTNFTFG